MGWVEVLYTRILLDVKFVLYERVCGQLYYPVMILTSSSQL